MNKHSPKEDIDCFGPNDQLAIEAGAAVAYLVSEARDKALPVGTPLFREDGRWSLTPIKCGSRSLTAIIHVELPPDEPTIN